MNPIYKDEYHNRALFLKDLSPSPVGPITSLNSTYCRMIGWYNFRPPLGLNFVRRLQPILDIGNYDTKGASIMVDFREIMNFLDGVIEKQGLDFITAPDANKLLERAGLLKDNRIRPGLPLRKLLRVNKIPHAFQFLRQKIKMENSAFLDENWPVGENYFKGNRGLQKEER